ncbi:MAG TPA: hypothetical protein VGP68_00230 [Gemmataceae bacterium]|jgi:hypothetical protein|nr:hypothetical protein [Gemmataceae bacterium]
MGVSARLHSAQALQDFRGSLAEFRLEVIEALAAADAGLQHMFDWLEHQQKHWRHEAGKRSELVIRARRELEERRHSNARDHRGCTEQEVAYRKARQRLQEAEEKGQRCRFWLRLLPQHQVEYDAPARMLAGMMETEVVKALGLLRQKIDLLQEYTELQTELGGGKEVSKSPVTGTEEARPADAPDLPG